jgi:hypothetical protein
LLLFVAAANTEYCEHFVLQGGRVAAVDLPQFVAIARSLHPEVTTAEAASAYRDAHDIATATAGSTTSNSTSSGSGTGSGSGTAAVGGAVQSSAGVVDFKVMNLSVILPLTDLLSFNFSAAESALC